MIFYGDTAESIMGSKAPSVIVLGSGKLTKILKEKAVVFKLHALGMDRIVSFLWNDPWLQSSLTLGKTLI